MDQSKLILAGVSGGPDSLCLLDLFCRIRQPILLAHFNHHLRPESDEEVRRVKEIAANLGVEMVSGEADVAGFASAQNLSIEEAARISRYQWLFSQAEIRGAQAVAVAHTANDQVETVLMHLLRGAGVSGLKGMLYYALPNSWSASIPLIRPLLGTWRQEVEAYLRECSLAPILDESNQDPRFFRNRIRLELIPRIEQLKPEALQSILRMTHLLQAEDVLFEMLIDRAWQECHVNTSQFVATFGRDSFLNQPLALQRRLVRRIISWLQPGLRDIDFETVERAVELVIHPPATAQAGLAAGLTLFFEGELVLLAESQADLPSEYWPQLPAGKILDLPVPGNLELPGGWYLHSEIIDLNPDILEAVSQNQDQNQAWLDADLVSQALQVRSLTKGDQFTPLGMQDISVHLADWMVNQKMPRRARSAWPLVLSGSDILWVPGYRSSHTYRVIRSTRRAIHLILHSANTQK